MTVYVQKKAAQDFAAQHEALFPVPYRFCGGYVFFRAAQPHPVWGRDGRPDFFGTVLQQDVEAARHKVA
jgi:hypothetical protein